MDDDFDDGDLSEDDYDDYQDNNHVESGIHGVRNNFDNVPESTIDQYQSPELKDERMRSRISNIDYIFLQQFLKTSQ